MYCGLSTASEAFLCFFSTQLYSCLCNYNAIVSYLEKWEVLQQKNSTAPTLPSPHFLWAVSCTTSIVCKVQFLCGIFYDFYMVYDGLSTYYKALYPYNVGLSGSNRNYSQIKVLLMHPFPGVSPKSLHYHVHLLH